MSKRSRFRFAMNDMRLSARAYDRILKVVRTMGGLDLSVKITALTVPTLSSWFAGPATVEAT